jgi:hypothetical protein
VRHGSISVRGFERAKTAASLTPGALVQSIGNREY